MEAPTRDLVETISRSLLGHELDARQVRALAAITRGVRIPAGEDLIRVGDKDQRLFLVVSGGFEAFRLKGTGTAIPFARLKPGQIVGEVGFLEGLERTATVAEHPDVAYALMRAILRSVHGVISRLSAEHVDLVGYVYS